MGILDQDIHDKDHKALANMVADNSRIIVLEQKLEEINSSKRSLDMWSKTAFGLVLMVGSWAFHLTSTIASQEVYISKLEKQVEKNTKFVSEWPTGKLGGLPEDSVQSTKIEFLEKTIDELKLKLNAIK